MGPAERPPWICIQRTGRRAWGGHPSITGALGASSGVPPSQEHFPQWREPNNFTISQRNSSSGRPRQAPASSARVGTGERADPPEVAGCRGPPHLPLSSFTTPGAACRLVRPTSSCALSPASSSGSRDELVLPSRLTLLPRPGLFSAEARGDSVFCFRVCSLARGMMSQSCGRCHTVR